MLNLSDYNFKLLDKQNAFYRFAFGYLDDFKRVIQKYDGKMPSKRIENDLKKVSPNFHYYKKYDWWFIGFYCPAEMRSISEPYTNSFGETYNRFENIKNQDFEFVAYEKQDEPVDAKALIEKVEKSIASRLNYIQEQEQAKANIANLVAEFNRTGEAFNKAKKALDCLSYVKDTKEVYWS